MQQCIVSQNPRFRFAKIIVILITLPITISCSTTHNNNLQIELLFDEKAYGKVINDASLSCSEIPRYDGNGDLIGTREPSSPKSWCNIQANNLPVIITDNKVRLHFKIDPPPQEAELTLGPSPEYDSPLLYIDISDEDSAVMMENITPTLWRRDMR